MFVSLWQQHSGRCMLLIVSWYIQPLLTKSSRPGWIICGWVVDVLIHYFYNDLSNWMYLWP